MRIVIDMQGAQTASRFRGIGRHTMAFARAIVRNRGEHEVILALSGLFPDTIEPIRAAFEGLLPQENIRVWHAVPPVASFDVRNDWRRQAAEFVREAFLASLKPDMVVICSLFEGHGSSDAVTSVGTLSRTIPTAVVLHDLIPYLHPEIYLQNPEDRTWYLRKIGHLRRADLWLTISESARREGIDHLGLSDDRTVNISTDADPHFRPIQISAESEQVIRQKYGLHRPFVMSCTGGIDQRKNIEGLIRAFAKLPAALRAAHQLAIVCHASPESQRVLEQLAAHQGLSKGDVVLTGYVPEDDLLALYNLCKLFVFPSWHEGFGLPALEAMRCGAPVIGANTSSLPEVIGWEEALFDPHSDAAMAEAMARALSDAAFRAELVQRGKQQSTKFSWDESARRAIAAMERVHAERTAMPWHDPISWRRPRLAFVSPLPPEKSGIADYSAELLPELSRHYEISVIVSQDDISDPWVKANCAIRSAEWFVKNSDRFDRVLYHFGNSHFHQHMFGLLSATPGVVVLHDFFLSGVVAGMDAHGIAPGYWGQELYRSHGYIALYDRYHAKDGADVVWKYPCNLSVLQNAIGVIVHSPHSLRLAEHWYGSGWMDWAVIPHLRVSHVSASADRERARQALGFSAGDFVVCSFGDIGPTKLSHRLLQAWLKSPLAQDKACHLVFVGMNHPGDYERQLLATIRRSRSTENIRITGWVDKETFRQYLAAADLGVQLRTLSRGETPGTVLDCMNHGLATIVNAHGTMADLKDEAVWKLPDEFTDEQLVEALVTLRRNPALRYRLGQAGRDVIFREHHPRTCADRYAEAIEGFYRSAVSGLPALPRAIAGIAGRTPNDADVIQLANAIARSFPPRPRQRQLLLDISALVQLDLKTGIQRIVRSILKEWLTNPPNGYRVEPVYTTFEHGYRYARRFTQDFLGLNDAGLVDEPIEFAPGDILFVPDLAQDKQLASRGFYQDLRRQGVQVKFMVHDLLPVLMPHCFPDGAGDMHEKWLRMVAESDGAVCVSKAVADELGNWLRQHGPDRQRPFQIDWSHHGADIEHSHPSKGLPADAESTLDRLRARPFFLMVGTVEPRKGHAQVLDAFEQLWRNGVEANLVIVGKQGWMVEDLVARLRAHAELGKRLFWLEAISDEYLEKVYAVSTCLIAASYGEGFGLPLIEAARHKLPIIARDIPVFREVAGEHAFYFEAQDGQELADAIREWLALYANGQHPKTDAMPWKTWKESAAQLLEVLGVVPSKSSVRFSP